VGLRRLESLDLWLSEIPYRSVNMPRALIGGQLAVMRFIYCQMPP